MVSRSPRTDVPKDETRRKSKRVENWQYWNPGSHHAASAVPVSQKSGFGKYCCCIKVQMSFLFFRRSIMRRASASLEGQKSLFQPHLLDALLSPAFNKLTTTSIVQIYIFYKHRNVFLSRTLVFALSQTSGSLTMGDYLLLRSAPQPPLKRLLTHSYDNLNA